MSFDADVVQLANKFPPRSLKEPYTPATYTCDSGRLFVLAIILTLLYIFIQMPCAQQYFVSIADEKAFHLSIAVFFIMCFLLLRSYL